MRLKLLRNLQLLIFLSTFSLLCAEANPTKEKRVKVRAPVYFPALPNAFSENFGIKVSRDRGRAFTDFRDENNPPISSPKPTTTTEKLPLARESHVASNSVTEAPSPSYLTDSLYYHDPTPNPNAGVEASHGHNDVFENSGNSLEDKEGEFLGLFLQSVSSYKPLYIGDRLALDPFINPASMHYIPIDSEEEISTENATTALLNSEVYNTPTTSTTTEKPTEYPLTRKQRPVKATVAKAISLPKPTSPPRLRYNAPTQQPKRIIRPFRKISRRPVGNIALRPAYTPIAPTTVISKGFLPKPAPNPFAARISKPVVRPVYQSPTNIRQTPSATITTVPTTTTAKPTTSRLSTNRSLFVKKTYGGRRTSPRRRFGQRKQKRLKSVGVFRTPITEKPSDNIFKKIRQNFGFDSNGASGSAPRRQYTPPSISGVPEERAPVYRTSTTAYRAPSSLFQIHTPAGKVVTAPAQPDFIKTESNIYVPHEYDEEAIPGQAGIDYPVFIRIPDTSFACSDQDHPGLYADIDAKCQVFHICQEGGREDSFLCPNGTIFNQQYFVCDWWYNFSCDHADRFYSLNALIYELPDADDDKKTYS